VVWGIVLSEAIVEKGARLRIITRTYLPRDPIHGYRAHTIYDSHDLHLRALTCIIGSGNVIRIVAGEVI
jgi:hypothetical protein